MRRFDPPSGLTAPAVFPSPFDESEPHPLALAAASALVSRLKDGWIAPGVPVSLLYRPTGGKMFGVLVVRAKDGSLGILEGFSGILDGAWDVPGFVPPVFDRSARATIEVPGEREVSALTARVEAYRASGVVQEARAGVEAVARRHAEELETARNRWKSRREARHAARSSAGPEAAHALDQESRGDKAERRALEERHAAEKAAAAASLHGAERRGRALERLRAFVSRQLMRRIHDTYVLRNFLGETTTVRALFGTQEPPGGTADCAAPKLLEAARVAGLVPVVLTEFWWGPPPATGGRVEGVHYPACRPKCGPVLPFMLRGLDVAPPVKFTPPSEPEQGLRFLHQDAALVVLEKPVGVLSIPGRGQALRDSIEHRLQERFPDVGGPILVHRLDLDTSGLLLGTLDRRAHSALQKQFERREVRKRYVAWVDGDVRGDEGTIELALRVDPDDRPRQVHDPVHGLPATTEWRVLERRDGRTRLALFPRTGRTHQLRAHCAHPLGLGLPIVGDRLYGRGGPRLLLHAEWIAFRHPATGEVVEFTSPAPF